MFVSVFIDYSISSTSQQLKTQHGKNVTHVYGAPCRNLLENVETTIPRLEEFHHLKLACHLRMFGERAFFFFLRSRSPCTAELTEQNDDAEQYGHQGAGGEPIREGQHLRVARLHVAAAVAGANAHDQRAGAALDGVVGIRDDHGQKIDAHLAAAEASPPGQDIGGVICRKRVESAE